MGQTIAKIKLYNPHDESKSLEIEILVDTGSTYTWIKREKLEKIGIKPFAVRKFRTIDNRVIERQIGEAIIECLGRRATSIIVFAENTDAEVLGLHALEGLGLEVDPVNKRLKEAEAILALEVKAIE